MPFADPEKQRASSARYRERNREKEILRSRRWAEENTERNRQAARRRSKATYDKNAGPTLARSAKRHTSKLDRTPKWADVEAIKAIYEVAGAWMAAGVAVHVDHVDHVVPLQGKIVSGLHVHENLTILPAKANLVKRNKFFILSTESALRTHDSLH